MIFDFKMYFSLDENWRDFIVCFETIEQDLNENWGILFIRLKKFNIKKF